MKPLLRHWRAWREARALARRAIPELLWRRTLAHLPFLAQRSDADVAELRRLASLFLDQKEFSGAGGLIVDDEIAVAIAAQACLPVLRMGLDPYRGFVGVVVHPDEVVARRETTDDDGVVHAWDEVLSGEAMEGGPVMLSWHDVRAAGESAAWGYNVVIHEFAHVLDMGDGAADGVPPLPDAAQRAQWIRVIDDEYAHFRTAVDRGRDTLLDPYGASGIDEFFAVASEAFFVTAAELQREHPALYALLAGYYRQDPATDRASHENARQPDGRGRSGR
jgi:MtfA peptidase